MVVSWWIVFFLCSGSLFRMGSMRPLLHNISFVNLTISLCSFPQGWMYAGLQAGRHCFCGNEYATYGEGPGTCRTKCSGNTMQVCGGGWRNMVYKTGEINIR